MKRKITVVAIIAVVAIAAFRPTLRAQQATSRSVLDGVYTQEQATRGEALYAQYCASCHGPTLMGEEMAPALTGGQFASNWNDLTVGEFFQRIRVSMPGDAPGSLSRQQYADIVAYVLSFNKCPAGTTELARETEILNQIRIQSPELP